MTDWKPYYSPNVISSPSRDLPSKHDWIEIKSLGEETSRTVRPRDLHEAMNVVDLYWRPANPPGVTPREQELDIALAQALAQVAQLEKEKELLNKVLHGTTLLVELVLEYSSKEKRPNE